MDKGLLTQPLLLSLRRPQRLTSSDLARTLGDGQQTRQAPARRDWPGLLLLAAGIVSFVLALASDTAWRGVAWLVLSETVAVAASWMIAYHPRNRETDPAARSRFTGEILVAASLALIFVWSLAGLLGVIASPWAGGGACVASPASPTMRGGTPRGGVALQGWARVATPVSGGTGTMGT